MSPRGAPRAGLGSLGCTRRQAPCTPPPLHLRADAHASPARRRLDPPGRRVPAKHRAHRPCRSSSAQALPSQATQATHATATRRAEGPTAGSRQRHGGDRGVHPAESNMARSGMTCMSMAVCRWENVPLRGDFLFLRESNLKKKHASPWWVGRWRRWRSSSAPK